MSRIIGCLALLAGLLVGVNLRAGETVLRVTDINPGWRSSFPSYLTVFDGRLYFRANAGLNDTELWCFDGTNASLVADISPGTNGSSPSYLAVFNGGLYFDARGPDGAVLLHWFDGVNARPVGANPPDGFWGSGEWKPVLWGGSLWWRCLHFNALGIAQFNGSTIAKLNSPPWVNSEPVVFDGALYYGAHETATGTELWRFNGSTQQRVSDINPGLGDASPEALIVHDGALFFRARDGVSGNELWRYNGGEVARVADINPGAGDSNPSGFASFGGKLYFTADDGVHGAELFNFDGTHVTLAVDINPNPVYEQDGDRLSDSWPSKLTVCGDALYFIACDGTNSGLWRFDGTNALILGGGLLNSVTELMTFQGALYFDADDGISGRELWKVESNAEPNLTIAGIGSEVEVHLNEAETGRFVIESSSDLNFWTPLATNSPVDGRIVFRDPLAKDASRRLYRAVYAE